MPLKQYLLIISIIQDTFSLPDTHLGVWAMTSFVIFFIILLGLLGKYSDSHVCTQSLHFQILKNNYTNLDCLKCKDVFLVGWLVGRLVGWSVGFCNTQSVTGWSSLCWVVISWMMSTQQSRISYVCSMFWVIVHLKHNWISCLELIWYISVAITTPSL